MKLIFTGVLLLCSIVSRAGDKFPKFGNISLEDLTKAKSLIDSTTGAEYIFSFGQMSFDHNFAISIDVHKRIKIYKNTELDRGDISIPYYKDDLFSKFKAATYNLEQGEIVVSKLDKKTIFVEEVEGDLRNRKFSLPNVKAGSIIEYSYTLTYDEWRSLPRWYFQYSIPVIHSEYIVSIPEFFVFYHIAKGYVTFDDYNIEKDYSNFQNSRMAVTTKRFLVTNVPAFDDEPYLASRDDYISNVRFELAKINIPLVLERTYLPSTYQELSSKFANMDYYNKDLKDNSYLKTSLSSILKSSDTSMLARTKAIYTYVRDSVNYDYDSEDSNLKGILSNKSGDREDINRLLIALLNQADIPTQVVRLSTFSNGEIHPLYPMYSSFNYTIAYTKIGDVEYLMDASDQYLPFGMLPKRCLNDKGLVVSENDFHWVDLTPKEGNVRVYSGQFQITNEETISGQLKITRKGYNALDFRMGYESDVEEYKEEFDELYPDWKIKDHTLSGIEDLDSKISEEIDIEIENGVQIVGDLMIFNPMIYARIEDNPFKKEERQFPVFFQNTQSKTLNYIFEIPDDYEVDEMPESSVFSLPDRSGNFIYNIQNNDGKIIVTARFQINKIKFQPKDYKALREFYTLVIKKLNENVALKSI